MNAMRNDSMVKRDSPGGSRGYSLIEMIVAIGMAAIIGMALYAIFNSQQRSSRSQKTYNDLQTSCTFAMDTLKSDLLLAGYKARTPDLPISAANPSDITFEFYDDKALDDLSVWDATYKPDSKVTYSLAGGSLNKTIERWGPTNTYTAPHTVSLADNIQALNFVYLKEDNTSWSLADGLGAIRSVRVNMVCSDEARVDEEVRKSKANAIYKAPELGETTLKFQVISLTAEVKPRNVNIARNPEDKTAPRVPASQTGGVIYAWDEGKCGCLQVEWTSNTDSDIAGYTVFYGLAPGNYTGRSRVTHQSGTFQTTTLSNLASTNVPYYIAIAAFDNSGNQSNFSTEIHGNPTPSRRSEPTSAAEIDTTITPLPPPAPTGLTVATPADNRLLISWTKTYSDCLTTPVFGYNIYRTADPTLNPDGTWDFIPTSANLIASVGPEVVSYLDTGTDTVAGKLVGCVPYYYKIAVKHCDPAKLSGYVSPDTTVPEDYKAAQFAKISGTPTDGTPPSAPILTSKSGFKRIILSLTNPSRSETENPDFALSRIYWSTTAYPVLTETRDADGYNIINGGDLIPDGGGKVSDGGGPHTINFDDTDAAIPNNHTGTAGGVGLGYPELDATKNYYFLAVAYDRCKNHNQDDERAMEFATQCGDEPLDAPPAPTNVRITRGCEGRPLKIEWDYAAANYATHLDFQGFRVVRCTGKDCSPLEPKTYGSGGVSRTVIGGIYMSPDLFVVDDTVDDGLYYSYRIFAGDCYYQRWLENLSTDPANPPENNASYFIDSVPPYKVTNVSLGYLDRSQLTLDATTTLTTALDDTATKIFVTSTTGFTGLFRIGTEVIRCATKVSNYFDDCKRGAEATMPVSHFAGDIVTSFPPSPPTPAISGDLTLNPPTFLHDSVRFGARNTSAGPLTLKQLAASWGNDQAFLKDVRYYISTSPPAPGWYTGFEDTAAPLTHAYTGSMVTLSDIPVAGKTAPETTLPIDLNFRLSDGSSGGLNMREDLLGLSWNYWNDATGMKTCSRSWLPPDAAAVTVPLGPLVSGTTQDRPAVGTFAWPVPGTGSNPMNAVIVPGGSTTIVSTYVKDNSGSGISKVYLYYYSDPFGLSGTLSAAPPVTGIYDTCTPYTRVPMTNIAGELWQGTITNSPSNDAMNVWYFIVAVDNRGNFDREPEIDQGAFQYQQLLGADCDNTPKAPVVVGSSTATSVTLNWSGSWYGIPVTYRNTDEGICTDLRDFKILRRTGTLAEETLDTLPSTQSSYTDTFTPISNSLTAAIDATTTTIPANTYGFLSAGTIKIGTECIAYSSVNSGNFLGCQRAQRCPEGPSVAVAHAAGASVTQDVLRFMNNTYRVQVNDNCPAASAGPKHSESAPWTESEGAPACLLVVNPTKSVIAPPNAFNAGDTFTIDLTVAGLVGGGVGALYVQTCSQGAADADPIRMVEESADNGVFHIDSAGYGRGYVKTYLAADYPASFIDLDLKVSADDTVMIGGWALTTNPLGIDWNAVCQSTGYICGAAETLAVETPVIPVDQCALDHTPNKPASLSYSLVGSCKTESGAPNNTSKLKLIWPEVTPPDSNYTAFRYKAYKCSTTGCSPATAITGLTWTCTAGICTSGEIDAGSQLKGTVFTFGVEAEYEIDNCATAPVLRTWKSTTKATVVETCVN